jgi:hypothetical protein
MPGLLKALPLTGCLCLALSLSSTVVASPLPANDKNSFPANRQGAGTRGLKPAQDIEEILIQELSETSLPEEIDSLDKRNAQKSNADK